MTSRIQGCLFIDIVNAICAAIEGAINETDKQLKDLRLNFLAKLEPDLKALRRRITETATKRPTKDYSKIRRLLQDWILQSEKGIATANGV